MDNGQRVAFIIIISTRFKQKPFDKFLIDFNESRKIIIQNNSSVHFSQQFSRFSTLK